MNQWSFGQVWQYIIHLFPQTWRSCFISWVWVGKEPLFLITGRGGASPEVHRKQMGIRWMAATMKLETWAETGLRWGLDKHLICSMFCSLIWASHSSVKFVFESNQVCFSANQLLDIFALDPHLPISKEHFRQICPAIIQQLLGNACESTEQKTRGAVPTALESKTFHLIVCLYKTQP